MRAVVQRVRDARVEVDNRVCGRIAEGLLVYLGVATEDTEKDLCYLAEKVLNLRIFPDQAERMNLSVRDSGGGILVVSQLTLYGDARQGRRPSYAAAAEPNLARSMYERFVSELRSRGAADAEHAEGIRVETGEFAARMRVHYTNVGPITILLDSTKAF